MELLKIESQMVVAGASCPNAALSLQTSGINRQGAIGESSQSHWPTVALGEVWMRGVKRGEHRSVEEWELFFALLD